MNASDPKPGYYESEDVIRWLSTWAPHCGASRKVFEGQFRAVTASLLARALTAEAAVGGCIKTLMKHGETNVACSITELAKPILARIMAAEERALTAEAALRKAQEKTEPA